MAKDTLSHTKKMAKLLGCHWTRCNTENLMWLRILINEKFTTSMRLKHAIALILTIRQNMRVQIRILIKHSADVEYASIEERE